MFNRLGARSGVEGMGRSGAREHPEARGLSFGRQF